VLERPIPIVPTLRGKTVVNLFFEPSTRTSTSFAIAAKRLSCDVVNFSRVASSVQKGETLLDTTRNIEAMRVDGVIIRHSCPGAARFLAKRINAFVINAGDGAHEHPTQALLDAFTLLQKIKTLEKKKILILGDIAHSRVARSDIWIFKKLGAEVSVCGPPTLIPPYIEEEMKVKVYFDLDKALPGMDVINVLRLQLERQKRGVFPSLREYRRFYCLTEERLKKAKKDVIIMHPGPLNRGIEIHPDVADGKRSVILHQVRAGVAVRMAILFLLAGGKIEKEKRE